MRKREIILIKFFQYNFKNPRSNPPPAKSVCISPKSCLFGQGPGGEAGQEGAAGLHGEEVLFIRMCLSKI